MTTDTEGTVGGSPRRTFQNRDDETVSETVVRAVSTASGRSPLATTDSRGNEPLEPLYDAIDPDALDALFETTAGGRPGTAVVEFVYADHDVTVARSGTVSIRPR